METRKRMQRFLSIFLACIMILNVPMSALAYEDVIMLNETEMMQETAAQTELTSEEGFAVEEISDVTASTETAESETASTEEQTNPVTETETETISEIQTETATEARMTETETETEFRETEVIETETELPSNETELTEAESETDVMLKDITAEDVHVLDSCAGETTLVETNLRIQNRSAVSEHMILPETVSVYHTVILKEAERVNFVVDGRDDILLTDLTYAADQPSGEYAITELNPYLVSDGSETGQAELVQYFGEAVFEYLANPESPVYYLELAYQSEESRIGTGMGMLIEQLDTESMVQTLADEGDTETPGTPEITDFSVKYGSKGFSENINVVYKLPQTFITRFSIEAEIKAETGAEGTLSYEWYSNTVNSYEGATLLDYENDGRNDLSSGNEDWYTKPTTKLGTTYYFCKVINTLVNGKSAYAYSSIGSVTIQEPEEKAVGIITNEEPIGKIYVKAEDTIAKRTDMEDKYGNPIEDPGPIGVIFNYSEEKGSSEDPQNGTGIYLYPSDTMTTVIARAALLAGKTIGVKGTGMGSYIYMLAGREEFDRGAYSGWMGSLNGWFTNTGFDNYSVANGELKPGDFIYLKYTTDLGKDIGASFGTGSESLKLKSLIVHPLKRNNYTATDVDFLNNDFDPDVSEYDISYRSGNGWKGVVVAPEAENANNKVTVFVGDQEYRGNYKIPITEKTTVITIKVQAPNAENDKDAVTYILRVNQDPELLDDGSVTLTEIAADGHNPQPAVYYKAKNGNSALCNLFTAELQPDTAVEAYQTKDLKVTLNDLLETVTAVVKYRGKSWTAENGIVTIPGGAQFTGTRTYTIQLTNTADGTSETYYLQLTKNEISLEKHSFEPMMGESKAEYVETINGQLEGTWFQLDAAGNETGKFGFESGVTDYKVYLGSFADNIVFTSNGTAISNDLTYAIRLFVDEQKLADSVVSNSSAFERWGEFYANVLKKNNLQTIALKEGETIVAVQLYSKNDEKITRTYTLHLVKKSATAAEIQEKILALPGVEDLSYSRDKGTVDTLQLLYDKLTQEQKNEISQEAKEKLDSSVKRIAELYTNGIAAIQTLKGQINQYKDQVTEENYKTYEAAVNESEQQFLAMTGWVYEKFVNECKEEYKALQVALEVVKKAKIVNDETIGEPTDYIDDFMVSANAFNLSVEAYKANKKAYPVNFKDYIVSNPQNGGTEACLPHNTPGRIKWEIEDESIFRIDSEIGQYIDMGLGGNNTPYPNELYYMVPLKEGTTTFTVTLTDATGGKYYGQTPKMVVHVNSEGEASIEKLEEKLTNFHSLPYTTKYDTWYYWEGTEGAEFTFHVNGSDAKVEVLDYQGTGRTEYPVDANGDVTVLLKDGYNPIEVSAVYEGQRVTQVYGLRAKVISYTLMNESRPGKPLKVGDQATLKVTGLTTPVYKILRIYNPSAIQLWYDTNMAYQSQILSGGTQYSIGASTFTVTSAGTCTLSNGRIYQLWWGSPLYSETAQGNTGGIAPQSDGFFSRIPDITFEVEENPEYKADIKIHTAVAGSTTVKPGDTVTVTLDDLKLTDITDQYPLNTTNTFIKLQTMQTQFMTTIPGLTQVTSDTYDRNKLNSMDVIKKVTFTVPADTPDGTYTIKGGCVRVRHGDPSYGISPTNMFQMQIDDVKITVQHEHSYGDWTVTKAASCSEAGVKTASCKICGDVQTQVIPANGHNAGVWETVKAEACTTAGTKVQKCTVCGETLQTESISAKGHTTGGWIVTKEATCTAEGMREQQCVVCGETLQTKEIGKKAHTYGSWTTVSQATVKAAEVQQRICSVCGTPETQNVGSKLTAVLELPGKITSFNMKKGDSKTLAVTMANGDSVKSVKSDAAKTLKASLNKKTGEITLKALKTGNAKLTIKLDSGKSRKYAVKVVSGTVKTTKLSVTSVSNKKLTLKKGKTHTLKTERKPFTSTQKVTYKTSNKRVATVTSAGKIKAVAPGKATITAKSGSKSVKITVTVPGITNVKSSVSLKKNKTLTLKPKTYGISGKVTYTSSNKKVATVTSKGKIKGIKKGTAKITIQAGSYKQTVTVKVK